MSREKTERIGQLERRVKRLEHARVTMAETIEALFELVLTGKVPDDVENLRDEIRTLTYLHFEDDE